MPSKPKRMVTVELPNAFTEFMQHVNGLILIGDDATTTESDDLLQCDCVYGGLYDATENRFGFRYFHDEDATWDFDLDAQQIADIASGARIKVNLWQCAGDDCRCLYSAEDSYCPHCDSIRHFVDFESELRVHWQEESDEMIALMASLRKVGFAVLDYHERFGHFPAPYTTDGNSKPMHSWRSLILPFLDCEDLFAQINFEQPWDSDANRALWSQIPETYRSQDSPGHQTRCVAVVDTATIWPPETRRTWDEISSGTSCTVAAIQSKWINVNWMQPSDLDMQSVLAEYASHQSILAVFVDGHVDWIQGVDVQRFQELVSI